MADNLNSKKIAIIATDGVEQAELVKPREAVEKAGGKTELLSLETGRIQAMNSDINPADKFDVDKAIADASRRRLRRPDPARRHRERRQAASQRRRRPFVQKIFEDGKPAGVICHGPWTLVEADLVRDRTSDVVAEPADRHPQRRRQLGRRGGRRRPGPRHLAQADDLPAFCDKIVEEFAEGEHEVASAGATSSS